MKTPNKFRVYSNLSKKWMSNILLNEAGTPVLVYSEKKDGKVVHSVFLVDNYQPIVQYAVGFIDKNNKEIYEGDILLNGSAYTEVKYEDFDKNLASGEVVGNIFDNSDLLKTVNIVV